MIRATRLGNYIINWDETYFLCFSGHKQEMTQKQSREYNAIWTIPNVKYQVESLQKLNPSLNPNICPISGLKLVELIKDGGWLPIFDPNFNETHKMFLDNGIIFEGQKAKYYESLRR